LFITVGFVFLVNIYMLKQILYNISSMISLIIIVVVILIPLQGGGNCM